MDVLKNIFETESLNIYFVDIGNIIDVFIFIT